MWRGAAASLALSLALSAGASALPAGPRPLTFLPIDHYRLADSARDRQQRNLLRDMARARDHLRHQQAGHRDHRRAAHDPHKARQQREAADRAKRHAEILRMAKDKFAAGQGSAFFRSQFYRDSQRALRTRTPQDFLRKLQTSASTVALLNHRQPGFVSNPRDLRASRLAPVAIAVKKERRDWLHFHEKWGHTLRDHVGKDRTHLQERINRGLTRASTFTNENVAHRAIAENIRANRRSIRKWLGAEKDDKPKDFWHSHSTSVGFGLDAKRGGFDGKKSVVVLRRHGANSYHIYSAYAEE